MLKLILRQVSMTVAEAGILRKLLSSNPPDVHLVQCERPEGPRCGYKRLIRTSSPQKRGATIIAWLTRPAKHETRSNPQVRLYSSERPDRTRLSCLAYEYFGIGLNHVTIISLNRLRWGSPPSSTNTGRYRRKAYVAVRTLSSGRGYCSRIW